MNVPQTSREQRNRRHWEDNLDAWNLREGTDSTRNLDKDLLLFETADVRLALDHLGDLNRRLALDLGGGLGLYAILLARRGAHVLIADISLPRLKAARTLLAAANVADRVSLVLCAAEHLPFLDRSIDRQVTKSVLIHTDLPAAAAELARTLAPDGRAAFIEPLDSNPFVNLYRRLAAPKIWQDIATYFDSNSTAQLAAPFTSRGFTTTTRPLYLLAFLATPINYILRRPRLYHLAETASLAVDSLLFKMCPSLRRRAWFVVTCFTGSKII